MFDALLFPQDQNALGLVVAPGLALSECQAAPRAKAYSVAPGNSVKLTFCSGFPLGSFCCVHRSTSFISSS